MKQIITLLCFLILLCSCSFKKIIHQCTTAPKNWELTTIDANQFRNQVDYPLSADDLFFIDNQSAIWHINPTGNIFWVCIPPKDFHHTNCGEMGKPFPLTSNLIDDSFLTKIIMCGS
jgi:hypothetical protein